MNMQNLLKSRVALALLAGIMYLTWKSLAPYFGLDDSADGLVTDAIGVGNGGLALVWALGHCDGLDGPVVTVARKALDTGNVNLVLPWVRAEDEGEIRKVFAQARSVRKLGEEARESPTRISSKRWYAYIGPAKARPLAACSRLVAISVRRFLPLTRRSKMARSNRWRNCSPTRYAMACISILKPLWAAANSTLTTSRRGVHTSRPMCPMSTMWNGYGSLHRARHMHMTSITPGTGISRRDGRMLAVKLRARMKRLGGSVQRFADPTATEKFRCYRRARVPTLD